MTTTLTPQLLTIGSLIVLLLVALIVRHFMHRRSAKGVHGRYGDDHSQAIADMGSRTRLDAQRGEREQQTATSPNARR